MYVPKNDSVLHIIRFMMRQAQTNTDTVMGLFLEYYPIQHDLILLGVTGKNMIKIK